MLFVLYFYFLLKQFPLSLTNPIIEGSPVGKIISNAEGKKVDVIGHSAFPFMVSIETTEIENLDDDMVREWYKDCGGSIIGNRIVLTVAHCLIWSFSEPEVTVRAGMLHTTLDSKREQSIQMLNYKIHENYIDEENVGENKMFQHNDIAIIWLKSCFQFNENVKEIPIFNSRLNPDGKLGHVMGWGLTHLEEKPEMLQKGVMRVLKMKECERLVSEKKYILNSGMMCIIEDNKRTIPCSGDSGGPFVIDNKLVGLLSYTFSHNVTLPNNEQIELCNPEFPAVLTHVGKYYKWIEMSLKKAEPLRPEGEKKHKCVIL